MSEEIKEILDEISEKIIPNEKWEQVKNYITNLQEKNKMLKDYKNAYENVIIANKMLEKENQKLVKAIDELLEDCDMMLKSLNYNSKNGIEIVQYKLANIINKLTELKGGSDEKVESEE